MQPRSVASTLGYRRDIDGLRAIAVLPVLLFHLDVPGFSGGFVGVDIFFVISGYLLTAIILAELHQERFSIIGFYERRVRRLFPALFVVLAVVSLASALMLSPLQFYDYAQTLLATIFFASNVLFAIRLDYFEGINAETRPLLHTWSLGVEEQFYLLLPGLIFLCWRFARHRVWQLIILIWIVSFAASIWMTFTAADIAFYHLPFRMLELLTGSLLAAISAPQNRSPRLSAAMGAAGALLIGATVALYSPDLPFPGIGALAPATGAALIIRAGQHGTHPVGLLLSTPLLVGIGLISYSLYLWHWPPIVLGQLYLMRPLTELERVAIFVLAVALATLSWRYAELPFRNRRRFSRKKIFSLAAAMLALFGAGASIVIFRFPDSSAGAGSLRAGAVEAIRRDSCHLDVEQSLADWAGPARCRAGSGRYRILLWGDSHAAHLMPGIREMAERGGDFQIVQITSSSCPPALGLSYRTRPECTTFNADVAALAAQARFDHVILAGAWEDYLLADHMGNVQATIDHLRRSGARVTLVAQGPRFYFDDPAIFERRYGATIAISKPRSRISERLARLRGATIFDPQLVLCQDLRCMIGDRQGHFHFDGHHLSLHGSRIMACALFRSQTALRRFRRCAAH
ncbi:MAG: acyltransferase family protein [Sphingomonas sp.]